MDYANKIGGLVIGTGDLSELALGWATYNGDHMSMYGVNASIPKTLVRYLVNWVAQTGVDTLSRNTLLDIIDTPISPELIPADENGNIKQKTEDLVGPYELHDFFLFHFLRFGFPSGKDFLSGRDCLPWGVRQHDYQEMAYQLLSPFLCATVQAFLLARWAESWFRIFESARRLAYAE